MATTSGAEVGQMRWSQVALSGCEDAYRLSRNPWKTGVFRGLSPSATLLWSWVSGVRIPSLTPLKPQVRRPGRDRGRAVQHDHRPSLGADLRISATHGGDFWEPILRPTLRGQPELSTGRWVKDPGAAGTLSSGPRICLIDRPPSQTAPRCHRPTQPGTQRRHRRSGPRRGDASHGSRCTQRLCWVRSRPTAKRHSGPRPCHRGRSSQGLSVTESQGSQRRRLLESRKTPNPCV
jgi:hypothetical protein